MKHVGEGIPLPMPGHTCSWPVNPACGSPVVDMLAPPSKTEERLFCGEHVLTYRANKQRRAEEAKQAEEALPRQTIHAALTAAMPERYADVQSPMVADPMARAEAVTILRERVNVPNLEEIILEAAEAAKLLRTVRGAIVVIGGASGTGKTTVSALILRMLANDVPLVEFGRNPLFRPKAIFGGEWNHGSEANPYVLWHSADYLFDLAKEGSLKRFCDVGLAVIDDIGGEPDQVNVKAVQRVTWARHDAMLPSILTTGFVDLTADPSDLKAYLAPLSQRYSTAFTRRIAEEGKKFCKVIALPPVMT